MTVTETVFPGADWETDAPEAHGLDPAALAQAAQEVGALEKRFGFLVVKDGVIVHETYFEGDSSSTYHTFSVTKGFGATLVGIAVTDGVLRVSDRVKDWLPVHHPEIAPDATVEHLLTMTAGGDTAGHTYRYNSGVILNSLPAIVWHAMGMPPAQVYDERIAQPLGLTLDWPRNDKGWMQIGSLGPLPVMRSNHRDLARLGLLWLNKGQWNGETILDQSYVERGLTPIFPAANPAYGYLWWLGTGGNLAPTPKHTDEGRARRPRGRQGLITARGARGQVIVVLPDENLVAVTMGVTGEQGAAADATCAAVEKMLKASGR